MAELRTRKPTGRVQFPLILVEGEDKGGKSFMLAQLAASPRVGQCFYLDIGDGTLDEYAPLGDYELLVHDGTWSSMIGQIKAACAVASDPERPNVVGVDSGSIVWALLKSWTDGRARNSDKNREKLKNDPDAEIDASMNLWNDAKDRWADLMQTLKMFPGIGVVTAVGREVSKVENGVPVAGQTEWSIDAEKTTTAWASAWVRVRRPHEARLVGVRSLSLEVPRGGLVLPDTNTLDHLVFEVLGAGGGFSASTAVQAEIGVPIGRAKGRVLDAVKRAYEGLSDEEATEEAKRLWTAYAMGSGQEVHKDRLTKLLLDIAEGTTQTQLPKPTGGDEPPEPAGAVTKLEDLDADKAIAHIRGLKRPDLVTELTARSLPTSGKVDDLKDRLIEALGLLGQPFGPGEPEAAPEPESGGDAPGEAPAVEIPEGWRKGVCMCGEPIVFEPGNMRATARHVDPKLDEDHHADTAE